MYTVYKDMYTLFLVCLYGLDFINFYRLDDGHHTDRLPSPGTKEEEEVEADGLLLLGTRCSEYV